MLLARRLGVRVRYSPWWLAGFTKKSLVKLVVTMVVVWSSKPNCIVCKGSEHTDSGMFPTMVCSRW
jgi:hypothetical protein